MAAALLILVGCATAAPVRQDAAALRVVATTGIIADLARQVGGERARVDSLVPEGADPHSYEPSLRDVRTVAYADVAFSNYLLLEQHGIIKTLDANLRAGVPNISLAEGAVKYAAEIIPLVENVSLDTVWLGMRVSGSGAEVGASRVSEVRLTARQVGAPPGAALVSYLTESFGNPQFYVNSSDGISPDADVATLPVDAHTHMSWAFTRPGYYTLDLAAELITAEGSAPIPIGAATFTFAVGVDPYASPLGTDIDVINSGHGDLTADLDRRSVYLYADPHGSGNLFQTEYAPERTVIEVPNKAISEIPAGQQFRFLGAPGEQIYLLPQAVLGKHVHGEIDPHLWQDVRNAEAYVKLIRDTLARADPGGAAVYRRNAAAYLSELEQLDQYVRATIAEIPKQRRQLITTHDAFGYLGAAYDVEIAGFVTPNPATEPSLAERRKLSVTIANLKVPAVFLEPNLASRSSVLTEIADEQGIAVCRIYGDSFDREVHSYVEMMRRNAESLRSCLT